MVSKVDEEFRDYYEMLEVSPNANSETIERVFRYLAKRYHPDASENGDRKRFAELVDAYNTLKDIAARAEYDREHSQFQNSKKLLVEDSDKTSSDCAERRQLLSLFYAKRRREMKTPGLGLGTLEQVMDCPVEVLNFHVWYFQQKKWIAREESGQLAITAEGVDRIEELELKHLESEKEKYLTYQPA